MNKSQAMLYIYDELLKGKVVSKEEMMDKLGIKEKTYCRYINDFEIYFNESLNGAKIKRSKNNKECFLTNQSNSKLNSKEILAISKVLLESRGFSKNELQVMIEKLVDNCFGEDKKQIKQSIDNEIFTYVQPKHNNEIIDKLWEINEAIKKQRLIEVEYTKIGSNGKLEEQVSKRILQPQGIMFSEYYFYLAAYILGHDFDCPVIYRIDRIKKYSVLEEGFKVNYSERFKPGEFRNLIQFMYSGKLQTVLFKFRGNSIEAVLDRLPTAEIVAENNGEYTVRTKVFGSGIKMWILSQGAGIEVLEPMELREEIVKTIQGMMENYK